jgi:adenylate kinase
MGMPGAGRGTQAKKIAEKYNLVYISTGKILRQEEVAKDTELGRIAKPYMDRGEIVPDEIAVKVIERKIKEHPDANGFVFKGFPRTVVQAYILDGLLRRIDSSISTIVEFKIPEIKAIKRLSKRAKSEKARFYDMDTDVIIQRFEVYDEKTKPVLDYFKRHKNVNTIDATGDPDKIFEDVEVVINESIRLAK